MSSEIIFYKKKLDFIKMMFFVLKMNDYADCKDKKQNARKKNIKTCHFSSRFNSNKISEFVNTQYGKSGTEERKKVTGTFLQIIAEDGLNMNSIEDFSDA